MPSFPAQHHKNDQGEEISQANRRFFDLAKKLQAIFRGGIPTPEEFGAIRNQMQHVLNINQVCPLVAITCVVRQSNLCCTALYCTALHCANFFAMFHGRTGWQNIAKRLHLRSWQLLHLTSHVAVLSNRLLHSCFTVLHYRLPAIHPACLQIQLTLESADHASECEVVYSCITQFQRGATLDDHCGVISKGVSLLLVPI
jgi:hypothetical protein